MHDLPQSSEDLLNLAIDRRRAGELEDAAVLLRTAIAEQPAPEMMARLQGLLGVVLSESDHYGESEAAYRRAIDNAPAAASHHHNLGNLLNNVGDLAGAERAYQSALALKSDFPEAQYALGMLYLRRGRFPQGWQLHEFRPQRAATVMRQLKTPEWRGQSLVGKTVLVGREQGLGDQIQMARFAPRLKALGAERVILAPAPPLAALFETLAGIDEVVVLQGKSAPPRHDIWVLPFSMPAHLDVAYQTLSGAPYLAVPPSRARPHSPRSRPRIGYVWRGNPGHANDRHRSLPSPAPFTAFARFGFEMVDLQDPPGDFADTAAWLTTLDLVVTVDTSMAHLAGALGIPCWVLLPAINTDWRWSSEGKTTAWYDSLRLFRQTVPHDWTAPMAALERDLQARFGA